jgi:tetratricopeptide (TPR) repeat protein
MVLAPKRIGRGVRLLNVAVALLIFGPLAAGASAGPASPDALDAGLRRGRQALARERYADALDAFKEAAKLDPKSSEALHGAGLASYYLGKPNDAVAYLEKAYALTNGAERRIVFNLAAAALKPNPMRSVKVARDYLARPTTGPDEQMLNLLGAALNRAEDKTTTYYADSRKFYFDYEKRLESKRGDGRRRWGTEWVPASDAAARWQAYETKANAVVALRKDVDRADLRLKREADRTQDILHGMMLRSEKEQHDARARLKAALKDRDRLRVQLKKAESQLDGLEKPPFPSDVRPLPLAAAE